MLSEKSKGNSFSIGEVNIRPINLPIDNFVRKMISSLEFDDEKIVVGLIVARRVIEKGLKVWSKPHILSSEIEFLIFPNWTGVHENIGRGSGSLSAHQYNTV